MSDDRLVGKTRERSHDCYGKRKAVGVEFVGLSNGRRKKDAEIIFSDRKTRGRWKFRMIN
jgi:hypothetical protein